MKSIKQLATCIPDPLYEETSVYSETRADICPVFFHSERMPHESVGSIRNNFFAVCCLSSAACYLRMFMTNLCGTLQAMMHVNGQINLNLYNLQ